MADDMVYLRGRLRIVIWQAPGNSLDGKEPPDTKPAAFVEYLRRVQHSMQILVRGKNP